MPASTALSGGKGNTTVSKSTGWDLLVQEQEAADAEELQVCCLSLGK